MKGKFMLLHQKHVRPMDRAGNPVHSGTFSFYLFKGQTCEILGGANAPDVLENQVNLAVVLHPQAINNVSYIYNHNEMT